MRLLLLGVIVENIGACVVGFVQYNNGFVAEDVHLREAFAAVVQVVDGVGRCNNLFGLAFAKGGDSGRLCGIAFECEGEGLLIVGLQVLGVASE